MADFSGRWIAVEPQKIAGHELVVTQDAAILRLEQIRLRSGETYDEFGRRRGPQKGSERQLAFTALHLFWGPISSPRS